MGVQEEEGEQEEGLAKEEGCRQKEEGTKEEEGRAQEEGCLQEEEGRTKEEGRAKEEEGRQEEVNCLPPENRLIRLFPDLCIFTVLQAFVMRQNMLALSDHCTEIVLNSTALPLRPCCCADDVLVK